MSALYIEVRAGEGGADAKDLVRVQAAMYIKLAARGGL